MSPEFQTTHRDAVIADWIARIYGMINELNVFDRTNPYSASRANRLGALAQEMSGVLEGDRGLRNDARATSVLQHLSPLVSVDCLILRDEQVLLVQKNGTDKWVMPGGLIEMGESLAAAGRREVSEEAGLDIVINGIVGMFDSTLLETGEGVHILDITLSATVTGGSPTPGGETQRAAWWRLDCLPVLEAPHGQRLQTSLNNRESPLFTPWIGA